MMAITGHNLYILIFNQFHLMDLQYMCTKGCVVFVFCFQSTEGCKQSNNVCLTEPEGLFQKRGSSSWIEGKFVFDLCLQLLGCSHQICECGDLFDRGLGLRCLTKIISRVGHHQIVMQIIASSCQGYWSRFWRDGGPLVTLQILLDTPLHTEERLYVLVVRILGYRSWGPGFEYRHFQIFLGSNWSGTGSSLPHEYNKELLGGNSSSSGLENREYGHRDPPHWPCDTLYQQKLAPTSPTSRGHSDSIVCVQFEST
jgi:hypothetical protein